LHGKPAHDQKSQVHTGALPPSNLTRHRSLPPGNAEVFTPITMVEKRLETRSVSL
jgi:hypothetical protein